MFYAILLDEYEEYPFEVPTGRTNVGVMRKTVPGDPKLYDLQVRNSA